MNWIAEVAVGFSAGVLCVALGYYLGRLSKVERAVDRALAKATRRPPVNPQKAEDEGGGVW